MQDFSKISWSRLRFFKTLKHACWKFYKALNVLYMSFDRFLLAVESRDLSQADKSSYYKSVFFFNFTKLQFLNDKICKIEKQTFVSVFLVWGKFERIESIHFAESSDLSCWETEKEVLLPITQLWERRHSYNTLVSFR